MERTFLMIKPDAIQRNLVGEIISRIERKGLKLVGAKLMTVPQALAEEHYSEHTDKPFYGKLISFITWHLFLQWFVEGEDCRCIKTYYR